MTVRIPVYCTVGDCRAERYDHVHQPTPCANGHDERHHEFVPPKSVSVQVDGKVRRVRVAA
jgi:hypothetical protein